MFVSHIAHTRNTLSIVTLNPLSRHSLYICSLRDVQPKGCDVTALKDVRRRHTRERVPNA